jgi:hypothetical protein
MKIIFTAIVAVTFLLSFSEAETYYVATNGNDVSGNGSKTSPWQTIPKGLRSLHAGDLLYIRGGVYSYNGTYGSQAEDTFGCNPTCPTSWLGATRVSNYSGETVVFRSYGFNLDNDWFSNGLSYFILEGETPERLILEPYITSCPDTNCNIDASALRVDNAVHHIRFKNLTVQNWPTFGFNGGNSTKCTKKPTNIEIIGTVMRNIGNGSYPGGIASTEYAMYPSCGDDWLIQGNRISGTFASGIHINSSNAYDNSHALNNFKVIGNIIEGRRSTQALTSACIVITRGAGHEIRNNLCLGLGSQAGVHKAGIGVAYDVQGAVIENNTVYGVSESCFQNISSNNIQFRNNICNSVASGDAFDIVGTTSGLVFQNNLCPFSDAQAGAGCIVNPDAGFVKAGTDFHLADGSPAINKGVTTSFVLDIEGKTRSVPFDLGAYEFGAISAPTKPSPPINLKAQ